MTDGKVATDNRIMGFDGLRAIAVTMVFAAHRTRIGPKFGLGAPGVFIFFVLSGYLIISILLKRRTEIEGGSSTVHHEISAFFQDRALRIFPAYYVMIAAVSLLSFSGAELINLKYLPLYTTYTTNIAVEWSIRAWPAGFIGTLWTLAIEEQFYIISAPAFLLTELKYSKYLLAFFILLGAAVFCDLCLSGMPVISALTDSFVNFGFLAAGGVLALFARRGPGRSSSLAVFLLAASLSPMALPVILHLHGNEGAIAGLARYSLTIISVALVWAVLKNQNSAFVSVLEFAPIRRLGRISYGFYLWHYIIDLRPYAYLVAGHFHSDVAANTLIMLGNYLLSILAAVASWRLIESPALKLRSKMRQREATGVVLPPNSADSLLVAR